MVRVGIRVMLGLQLVSSRFGIILCRLIWTAILCCDIFASEINTLLYYDNMVRVRWLKIISIIVENGLHEYEIRGKNEL